MTRRNRLCLCPLAALAVLAGADAIRVRATTAAVGTQAPENATIRAEPPSQRDARMKWWRDANFGLFIHWGVYAVPAGKYGDRDTYGEWIMHSANIANVTGRRFRLAVERDAGAPGIAEWQLYRPE